VIATRDGPIFIAIARSNLQEDVAIH